MPHSQKHRGANPKDHAAFATKHIENLQQAVSDLSWLLSKEYSPKASLKLVGDKFYLTDRQRKAIQSASSDEQSLRLRKDKEISIDDDFKKLNSTLVIDGYNLLITTECALSGAPLFIGLDDCLRDIASIHSTYRKVEETLPALELIGKVIEELEINDIIWILDAPISNSGRLKKIIEELAEEKQWNWKVVLEKQADKSIVELSEKENHVVASCDAWITINASRWTNLCSFIVESYVPSAWIVDLRK
ncbi:DUF434 domain-containing protein [Bernardetia sp.]|uniref:DUF434 domain-containing protein n=1 Tax=Bernardetia sp. TaxID=1937974 RepID=UPI0025C65E72|nr:DUF434 domain-containing protein [Bernardetia sp.]